MSDLPLIKLKSRHAPWKTAGAEAMVGGLAGVLGAASSAVDRMPHDPHGLLQYLHVRLYELDSARGRAGNPLGRLWNRLIGAQTDYVEMSGVHLTQVLRIVDQIIPDGISAGRDYLMRRDLVREAYGHLRTKLG